MTRPSIVVLHGANSAAAEMEPLSEVLRAQLEKKEWFPIGAIAQITLEISDALDAMHAHADTIHVRQRRHNADRPVPAHAEVRDAVEKDHSGDARVIDRRA